MIVALLVMLFIGMTGAQPFAGDSTAARRDSIWRQPGQRPEMPAFIQDAGPVSAKPANVAPKPPAFAAFTALVARRTDSWLRVPRTVLAPDPLLTRSAWVGVVELRI